MSALTASQALGNLLEDPDSDAAVEGLREVLASGDAKRIGTDVAALMASARQGHVARYEMSAASKLLELETPFAKKDPDREAALWKELGKIRRDDLLDDKGARDAYAAAVALRPGDEEAQNAVAALDERKDKWKELGKKFLDEAESASEGSLKASLLASAALIVWQYKKKGRDKEVDALFKDALAADPSSTRAALLYERTLRSREKWDEAAAVVLNAAENAKSRDDKLRLFLRVARVLWRRLDQKDRAAACYERVLDFAPGHAEAMSHLVEYFTGKEMWDHLAALYEDALRSRQKLESEQGILLQIGMVHWRMRGKPDEAEPYFARLRKIDPAHPAMLDFYREHLANAGDDSKLLGILGDAQRTSSDTGSKLKLAIEVARQAQGNTGALDRAIDAWKAVQRLDPENGEAHTALRELYARAGKWNALVEVLKSELDALPQGETAKRIALLREMVPIYREKLSLDVMVINTYNAILQLVPEDAEALEALAKTYETLGRWNDLIQVLGKQADATSDKALKVALYMRVANLWIDRFANHNQATRPLEHVFTLDPNHREALLRLKDIYAKKRAWKPLFDVLRREADLASDPTVRLANLIELAKIAGERLHQAREAIELWKEVLKEDPRAAGALEALEKLAEREKDFATLGTALELRAEQAPDDAERVKLLSRLAALYGENLADPKKAASAWKRVLTIEPKNGRALRTLRESYLAAGAYDELEALYAEQRDWEGLVEVLGAAADKVPDVAVKVRLSLRAAEVYESQIGETGRAFRSYERVLAADPTHERAARALIAIYEKEQKWARLPALYDVVLAALDKPAAGATGDASRGERLTLLSRLRDLALGELREPERAVRAAREAYALAPDDATTRAGLETAAERGAAWEALAEAFIARIDGGAKGDELLSLRRRVAQVALEKLGRSDLGEGHLRAVLELAPADVDAAATLERIYREGNRDKELRGLLEHKLEHAEAPNTRHTILAELARIEEPTSADAAATRYRAMLELDPDDDAALAALDRLATAASRNTELADVLRRRAGRARDTAERAELLLRLGQTLDATGDPRGALAAYAEAIERVPGHGRAIVALEQLSVKEDDVAAEATQLLEGAYERAGAYDKLARLLERRLGATKKDAEKRELRLRIAELSGSKLGDVAGAFGALESAFLDHPSDTDLWDRLQKAAEEAKQHEALAAAFAMAVEDDKLLGDADRAALARRVAALYDDVLGRPDASEPFHKRVLAHDALDERAFLALKELYTTRERWDDLQLLYRNRISQTVDAEAKLDLLMQVCFLFEELLNDAELAIRAYRDVLELAPDDGGARRALEKLFLRTQKWRDLADLVRSEVDRAEGEDRVARLFQLGELHEKQLDEPSLAVEQYEAVLAAQSSHTAARAALERLMALPALRQRVAGILEPVYDHDGAVADLVRVLEVQLEDVRDPGSRIGLLSRIAELAESRLNDVERAFGAVERAVLADPGDAHQRQELARLAAMRGFDRQRADVLERAALATDSPSQRAEILGELASLYDDRLGARDDAERTYDRLLVEAPDDPETVLRASRALEAIHLAKGDHAKLAEDLRRQLPAESDAAKRSEILVRLGALVEDVLGDAAGAAAVHRERLEADPSDVDAMRALERLYERLEKWSDLVQVLQARDGATSDDGERRGIAKHVARIQEEKLEDRPAAIRAWDDLVASFGPDRESLAALGRLYEAAERWSDLSEILGREIELLENEGAPERERAEARYKFAHLAQTRENAAERAIEGYAEVLGLVPDHAGATAALEGLLSSSDAAQRVAAARVLVPRYEAAAKHTELVLALEVLAESDDPPERLRALRRAAEVAETYVNDPSMAFALTGRAVRAGTGEDDLPQMLADLERLAASAGKWSELVDLLAKTVPDILDADLQNNVHAKIAEVARTRLADLDLARTHYEKILEQRPEDLSALDALEELLGEKRDHRALREVLRRKAELASSPDARLWILLREAELNEHQLDDVPAAIEAYEQVLADADKREAYEGLERLYARAERWDDLCSLYEREIEKKVGNAADVRFKLGQTKKDKLGDTEGALVAWEDALSRDGRHAETIAAVDALLGNAEWEARAAEILEPSYLAALDWPKVTLVLDARLRHEESPDERKKILVRLGDYHETQREDLDAAFETYARLFREDPLDSSVWDTLGRLARSQDRHARLADVFDALLDERGVDDPELARLARHTGQLHLDKTHDLARAAKDFERALRYSPEDREAFTALETVLVQTNDHDALRRLYREQADAATSDSARVGLLAQLAGVQGGGETDPAVAAATYREILEVDPTHEPTLIALDALLTKLERWDELADLLRQRLDQSPGGAAEVALRHRLGELLATRLDDKTSAIDAYEEILRTAPDHAPTIGALEVLVQDETNRLRIIQILEPIYERSDQWKKLVAVQEAQLPLLDDPMERVRVLSRVAELHERKGRDGVSAFRAWARALAEDPGNEDVRGHVDRLAGILGLWDDLVAAYEAALAKTTDASVIGTLLATMARVHDERRGDPRSAIETYERLLAHDESDASPLDALEALHTMVGDWRGLVEVLRRKVERSYDAAERGELLRRAGSVLEELMGDRRGAIDAYRRAAEEDERDEIALESLDRLYVAEDDHESLATVVRRRLEVAGDADLRVELGLRLGALCEETLRQPSDAVAAYERVLEERAGEPTAVAALSRLYERQGMHAQLLDNLKLQATLTTDPTRQVPLVHRAGEVLERDLDDVPEAISLYRDALSIDSRHEPSIAALLRIARLEEHRARAAEVVEPLLREQGRWDELASLLERTAETMSDPLAKRDELRRLAEVHERGRNDRGAAFEALRRALAEDPQDASVLADLSRLAGELNAWDRFADTLAARASSVLDPDAGRALYTRLAVVAEERLNDDARAIEAYRRAIEQSGDDDTVLAALDRLYLRAAAHEELAEVLGRRLSLATDPTHAMDLSIRLAILREQAFDDRRGAFAAYREVLERDPTEPRALAALERLAQDPELAAEAVDALENVYRQTGQLERVANLFDAKLRLADTKGERVRLLVDLAALEEHDLRRPDRAAAAFRRAFELDPRDEALLGEIERLAPVTGSWETLRGIVEAVTAEGDLDRNTRRDLHMRAATWYRDRLGDVVAAEQQLRAAIHAVPDDADAHAQLVALLRVPGREKELVVALRGESEVIGDELERKQRLREAAHLAERSLGDAETAALCDEAILALDASDGEALDDLARLREAAGRYADVVPLLARRVDAEPDPAVRSQLRHKQGEILRERLQDAEGAIAAYRAALDDAPTDTAAMAALEALYEQRGAWNEVAELLERRLDVAETKEERIAARVGLARLKEARFGQRAEAIAQLEEILGEDAQNVEALDEMERLLAADQRWDALAELLDRRAAHAVSAGDTAGELAVLGRLAALEETHRGAPDRAVAAWERALERKPDDEASLRALVRLHAAAGDHGRHADALERLVHAGPPDQAVATALLLAELAATKLADPARAEAALRQAMALAPDDPEPRGLLGTHLESHGSWEALAALLAEDAERKTGPAQVALVKRIASIYETKLRDPGRAAAWLERASKLAPEDRDVLLPLVDLFIAAGRQSDAIPLLQQVIATFAGKRTKEVAQLHHRLGLALEGLHDTAGALAQYDSAFKIDLTNVAILRDLGRLTLQAGDLDRAQKTFRALLLQKLDPHTAGITKADVYFYLGDISAKQADKPKAISMLERAIAEDKAHARAKALLAELKG